MCRFSPPLIVLVPQDSNVTQAHSKRRSIHVPNLTDEASTAEERRLNQFVSAD